MTSACPPGLHLTLCVSPTTHKPKQLSKLLPKNSAQIKREIPLPRSSVCKYDGKGWGLHEWEEEGVQMLSVHMRGVGERRREEVGVTIRSFLLEHPLWSGRSSFWGSGKDEKVPLQSDPSLALAASAPGWCIRSFLPTSILCCQWVTLKRLRRSLRNSVHLIWLPIMQNALDRQSQTYTKNR